MRQKRHVRCMGACSQCTLYAFFDIWRSAPNEDLPRSGKSEVHGVDCRTSVCASHKISAWRHLHSNEVCKVHGSLLTMHRKGNDMRLDKYLKVSRLIKRRTVANEACDSGRVLINDKPAKASANVKEGDIITISFGNKDVRVEVLDVQETVRKEEAKELFRYL